MAIESSVSNDFDLRFASICFRRKTKDHDTSISSVLLNKITLLQKTTNKKHENMAQNEVLKTQTK